MGTLNEESGCAVRSGSWQEMFALKSVHDLAEEEASMCAGCGLHIHDRFFLQAVDSTWHLTCLRCCLCKASLESEPSCFAKNGLIYCRDDYLRLFASRACARCGLKLDQADLVMRVRELVFHLACFTCATCHRGLNTGELFGLRDGLVYCQEDYDLLSRALHPGPAMSCPPGIYPPPAFVSSFYPGLPAVAKGRPKKKRGDQADLHLLDDVYDRCPDDYCLNSPQRQKRMRTSFKHHQLRTMKAYFALNHNPDAKDLKQLADKTGLSKRVLQVWFQNARAKFRRSLMRQEAQKSTEAGDDEKDKSPCRSPPPDNASSGKQSPPLSDVSSTPPLPLDSNSYVTDSDHTADSGAASVSIGAAAATLYSDAS